MVNIQLLFKYNNDNNHWVMRRLSKCPTFTKWKRCIPRSIEETKQYRTANKIVATITSVLDGGVVGVLRANLPTICWCPRITALHNYNFMRQQCTEELRLLVGYVKDHKWTLATISSTFSLALLLGNQRYGQVPADYSCAWSAFRSACPRVEPLRSLFSQRQPCNGAQCWSIVLYLSSDESCLPFDVVFLRP